jgi:hypothetical protein
VQLPPDFDVEGMVAATWGVVKHVSSAQACNEGSGSRTRVSHPWMLLHHIHTTPRNCIVSTCMDAATSHTCTHARCAASS